MPKNNFNLMPMNILGNPNSGKKRTLGIRDKQILYRNAKGKCENPACKKSIDFDEMQVGHKKAYSKGGNTTLKNSVCLCYRCNKLQGTDSWEIFLKKQGLKINKITKTKETKSVKKPIKKSSTQTWDNPITGRREKFNPFSI